MIYQNINNKIIIYLMILIYSNISAQEWQSKIIYYENGKLIYVSDSLGNRIPDFSFAGYKNGNEPVPDVQIVKSISPVEGDNTLNIINAIRDIAENYPVQPNGFRGALLLKAGIYEVRGTIKLNESGIVLKGEGSENNPASNTIILGKGNSPAGRSIIVAGGGVSTKWNDMVPGSKVNIISDTVKVGENKFIVENTNPFEIGDNIIIYHPCTQTWLEAIDFGGTHSDEPGADSNDTPWEVGSQPIVYNRYITDISGDTITIDVPVYYTLIRALSQSYIYKYSRLGLKRNIGIENLRVDIETSGDPEDEEHAKNAVDLFLIEDAWVRNVTTLHFVESGFRTNTATRITISNCKALDPVSKITGGRRYNFNAYTASQQILFKDNLATHGRHSYVSNGTSWTSGIVFYHNYADSSYAASEGHRRWSQGLLYDNHVELSRVLAGYNKRRIGLYNRGYYGTSHGWASVNSVAWNCDVKDGQIIIQQPPTAQNYAIGCSGSLIAGYGDSSFDEKEGYIEGSNKSGLLPQSLYLAQYNERMNLSDVHGTSYKPGMGEFFIYHNYPNPFNPSTRLKFYLPEQSVVTINIYDITARKIRTLLYNRNLSGGVHSIEFTANNIPSGVYFCSYTVTSVTGKEYKKIDKLVYLK